MSSLSGMDQASASRDDRSSHAAARSGSSVREEERRRRGRSYEEEERPARRSRSRRENRDNAREAESRRSRRRREREDERFARDERRAHVEARAERRARQASEPQREHVSAYFGESTVVSVSTRSERRRSSRSSGFTLVPPANESTSSMPRERGGRSNPTRDDGYVSPAGYQAVGLGTSYTGFGSSTRFGSSESFAGSSAAYSRTRPATSSSSLWDDMPGWGGGSVALRREEPLRDERPSRAGDRSASASDRLPRRTRDGSTVQRDWLYTGEEDDDIGEAWVLARLGYAVMDGVAAVPRGIASGISSVFGHARGLLVLALAAFTAFMLYAPARELYIANRRLDTLQATYDVLLEENETIRDDLELLQTREGIENEARARGFVEPGETKVIVEGLPESELSDPTAFLEPLEVPENRPWYIELLDALFGYEME